MVKKVNLSQDKKKQLKKDVLDVISPVAGTGLSAKPLVKNNLVGAKSPGPKISPVVASNRVVPVSKPVAKVATPISSSKAKAEISSAPIVKPIVKNKVTQPQKTVIKTTVKPVKIAKIKKTVVVKNKKITKPKAVVASSLAPVASKVNLYTKGVVKNPKYTAPDFEALLMKDIAKSSPVKPIASQPASKLVENKVLNNDCYSTDSVKSDSARGSRSSWYSILFKTIIFVVLLLVFVFVVDIFGIYRLGWKDSFSYQTAKYLSLPAASVNGYTIKMSDYFDDLRLLEMALANKREGIVNVMSYGSNGEKIINRLVAIYLIEQKDSAYKKSVSEMDVSDQMTSIVQQMGGTLQAQQNIFDLYGLNLNQFRDKILKPLMEREALQAAIINDESLDATKVAKDKAQNILNLAKQTSTDFTLLAKQYTDDEAGVNTGGDLGWVAQKDVNPNWQKIFSTLPINTVYSQLVKDNQGYHIVKLEDKGINPETKIASFKLRHILVKVDVDKYIKSLIDASKVKRYIKN